MALDDNGRKELYRKLLNDPATSAGTKKYSFTQWEQKLAESPNALAKIGAYAISKKWANDLEDFSNRYGAGAKPYTPPATPKPKAAPVAAPVAVEEEEAFVEPPVGIAAPVPQKPQTFTDIAREEIAKVPKTRPVSKPIEPISMEPQGFFEGLGTQFQRGIAQGRAIQSVNMGQLRDAAQGKNLDAIPYEQIAEANRAVKQFGQTQTEVDLAKKEGLIKDAWDVVKALPGVTIESLASLGRSGLEEALVGAGMGAAAGSVVPVIGTAVGGGLGATSGMVQAGRNMEYFGTLMQELEANGVDITDAKQLREGIAKYGKNADKTAITRANTIAAVETALPIVGKVAGTAAGRVGSKVVQKPLQAVSKALTYEPIAGPLGGATGELAAQIASGQEIDPQAIALEAGGEGAATVAAVARAIKGEKKTTDKVLSKIQERNKIAQAMEEAVKANPEAEGQIRQQYQKRINEAAPTDEEVLSAYESLSVLPETEEKNAIRENLEAYMAEKGIAPEAEVETVSAEELQGPGFQIAYAKTREEIPQEYRGTIVEIERPTTRLGRFGPMERLFAYRVPTETIDITAPEAVTEEDIAEEIPFEEVPAEEVVVPPQEEDEDLAAFGREVEAIERAAPVAPAEEEVVTEEVPAEPVAPEAAPEVVAAAPVEEAALVTPAPAAPEENDAVQIAPQREGGSPRNMVFKDGQWQQNVGGDIVKVGSAVQQQAQEAFARKEETKPAETKEGKKAEAKGSVATKVEEYEGVFNPDKTGVAGIDELLEDDGYQFFYKGKKVERVLMSPDEYLERVRKGLKTKTDANILEGKTEAIKKAIESGAKINAPFISTVGGKFSQEGRNRAVVARELGEQKIPVFIESDVTFDDKINRGADLVRQSQEKGNTTKESVLEDIKKSGLHRDGVRFIEENYDAIQGKAEPAPVAEKEEGKKAEAKEEKPTAVVSEKDVVSTKIKEIAEKFKSIESELQGEIDVQDFSDRLRKRYEEIKSQYGEAKANEVLKSESNRADKIIKESRDGILKRLKGEYFKKNGFAPSSIKEFQKGIDSGEYKIDDLPSYKDAVSAKIVEETKPSAPSFTSQQSSEAATAFDKAKTSKGFDKKYGKGAYKALSDITKNFEDIMDKVSDKIKQDCL